MEDEMIDYGPRKGQTWTARNGAVRVTIETDEEAAVAREPRGTRSLRDCDARIASEMAAREVVVAVLGHRDARARYYDQLDGLPRREITEADALTGCLLGPVDGGMVYLVDVVDREPPGTYAAWGVLADTGGPWHAESGSSYGSVRFGIAEASDFVEVACGGYSNRIGNPSIDGAVTCKACLAVVGVIG